MLAPYVCGRPLDDYTQTVSFLIKMELSKKDNPPVFSFGMEALRNFGCNDIAICALIVR